MDLYPMIEDLWDLVLYDTLEELAQFIDEVETDESIYPHHYDFYNASYRGLTPMEYLFDDVSKQFVLQRVYND